MKKKLLALFAVLALSGCSVAESIPQTSVAETVSPITTVTEATEITTLPTETASTAPEEKPKESFTVSFCAVGDNLIHSPIYRQAQKSDGYDFSAAYADVADIIQNADVAVINQETLICNDMYEPSNPISII